MRIKRGERGEQNSRECQFRVRVRHFSIFQLRKNDTRKLVSRERNMSKETIRAERSVEIKISLKIYRCGLPQCRHTFSSRNTVSTIVFAASWVIRRVVVEIVADGADDSALNICPSDMKPTRFHLRSDKRGNNFDRHWNQRTKLRSNVRLDKGIMRSKSLMQDLFLGNGAGQQQTWLTTMHSRASVTPRYKLQVGDRGIPPHQPFSLAPSSRLSTVSPVISTCPAKREFKNAR